MKQFDGQKFLKAHFSGAADLVRMVSDYGLGEIPYDTANKWFQRGTISATWFPHLLCVLELERGGPVTVWEFFS